MMLRMAVGLASAPKSYAASGGGVRLANHRA
jgi:hypothetical protein